MDKRAGKKIKKDVVERHLKDGRKFNIHKNYFGKNDLSILLENHGIKTIDRFLGNTFTAIIGQV